MKKAKKKRTARNPLISSFKMDGRVYERSLVDCGKANCSRCRTPDGRAGSHGPYWYMCATRKGRWRRVYIGKNLDTARFVLPDGHVDWLRLDVKPLGSRPMSEPPLPTGDLKALPAPRSPGAKAPSRLKTAAKHLEALDGTKKS